MRPNSGNVRNDTASKYSRSASDSRYGGAVHCHISDDDNRRHPNPAHDCAAELTTHPARHCFHANESRRRFKSFVAFAVRFSHDDAFNPSIDRAVSALPIASIPNVHPGALPVLALFLLLAMTPVIVGCHHSSGTTATIPYTPTGTYTLTVQGSAQNAGRGFTVTLVVD